MSYEKMNAVYCRCRNRRPTWDDVDDFVSASNLVGEQCRMMQSDFLGKCGWRITFDTPGDVGLFEKQMPDGRVMLCDLQTALRVEASIAPSAEGGRDGV